MGSASPRSWTSIRRRSASGSGSSRCVHIDDLPELVKELAIAIGVIATPATAVQDVADRMVAAGIRSILNFAPAPLVGTTRRLGPDRWTSRSSSRSSRYYEQRKAVLADVRRRGGAVAFAPTR